MNNTKNVLLDVWRYFPMYQTARGPASERYNLIYEPPFYNSVYTVLILYRDFLLCSIYLVWNLLRMSSDWDLTCLLEFLLTDPSVTTTNEPQPTF